MGNILCTCQPIINIARGSTFTMQLVLPETYNVNNFLKIYITFVQNDKEILTLTETNVGKAKNVITVTLSQKQTLGFKTGRAKMQLRAKINSKGECIVQEPITELNFLEILRDGEI